MTQQINRFATRKHTGKPDCQPVKKPAKAIALFISLQTTLTTKNKSQQFGDILFNRESTLFGDVVCLSKPQKHHFTFGFIIEMTAVTGFIRIQLLIDSIWVTAQKRMTFVDKVQGHVLEIQLRSSYGNSVNVRVNGILQSFGWL